VSEGFFPGGGAKVDFPGVNKNIFPVAAKVAKFHFTHSKLRKRPILLKNVIGKCHISNSREGQSPPYPHSRHPCLQE